MVSWLVLSLIPCLPAGYLMPTPLLDLPLLHYLLHEPLGYRPSLPHVLCLFGYAFNLSTIPLLRSGLNAINIAMGIVMLRFQYGRYLHCGKGMD